MCYHNDKKSCKNLDCNNKCGWCDSLGQCLKGNNSGPIGQTCSGWSYNNCNSPSTCIRQESYGWCNSAPAGQQCQPGNANGPFGGTCAAWYYTKDTCLFISKESCKNLTCNDDCGWCDSLGQCLKGNSNGPIGQTCNDWNYNDCNSPSTCISQGSYGWCNSAPVGQQCQPGNVNGPYNSTCEAWYYTMSTCLSTKSKESCINVLCNNKCGWCDSLGQCLKGDVSGPIGQPCSGWKYTNSCDSSLSTATWISIWIVVSTVGCCCCVGTIVAVVIIIYRRRRRTYTSNTAVEYLSPLVQNEMVTKHYVKDKTLENINEGTRKI
eukprot:NODE_2257_length_1636_cov_27.015863_g1934_i0.p1 GENE.NODE_2257_length_1636_cov_27.015863_g1934_i0~~NODE_2257_length_1636_cov_27.015863_g1934_i0.p1  ORF type:complete len:321 (-),score=48.42 NODE_2257_length_1636_cov_27.015863_g1934_i0:112-1074(-)